MLAELSLIMPGKAACISATPKPITTALVIKPSAVGKKILVRIQ